MKYDEIMVRYGELSTKGKNRNRFISQLQRNIQAALVSYPNLKVKATRDRTHILLNGEDSSKVIPELKKVFGIQNFSPAISCPRDLEKMKQMTQQIMQSLYREGMTFKISAKRSDHDFEMDSTELNQFLGASVFEVLPNIQAQMKKPDVNLQVEVRLEAVYFSFETIKGAGGLPVGTSGRGMLMLSGGIDSPVAGFLAMKRGVEIEAVHFASPPYTSEGALQKAKDLAKKLTHFSGNIQFIEVPFTKIQEEIKEKAPTAYLMTITRRFMMRITDELRHVRKGLVIVNGESLGQVASQTLHSMIAINDVTTTPVIRPVITMDKNEIIEIAEEIDTFNLSIQPFEDCCTIFAPPNPKTKPKLEHVLSYESRMDVEKLVQDAVNNVKITSITPLGEVGENVVNKQDEFEDLL